jgi:hypothetical protein
MLTLLTRQGTYLSNLRPSRVLRMPPPCELRLVNLTSCTAGDWSVIFFLYEQTVWLRTLLRGAFAHARIFTSRSSACARSMSWAGCHHSWHRRWLAGEHKRRTRPGPGPAVSAWDLRIRIPPPDLRLSADVRFPPHSCFFHGRSRTVPPMPTRLVPCLCLSGQTFRPMLAVRSLVSRFCSQQLAIQLHPCL